MFAKSRIVPPPPRRDVCRGVQGLTEAQAADHFWILDASGLITKARQGLTAVVEPFARLGEADGESLIDVVKRVSIASQQSSSVLGMLGWGVPCGRPESSGEGVPHDVIYF